VEIILEHAGRRSPSSQLSAIRMRLAEVASEGKWFAQVEEQLRSTAMRLVRAGYLRRESPDGVPWRLGKSSGGDLIMSGAMFASLRVEDRATGFAITDRVTAVGGSYYGGSHQYGRTIKAKGYSALRSAVPFNRSVRDRYKRGPLRSGWGMTPVSGNVRLKMRAHRFSDGRFRYVKEADSKPLTWRTPDGKWHSAYKIRIPARPIVPRSGHLPELWSRDFERACDSILRNVLGVGASR
jgi:hypothetical protein